MIPRRMLLAVALLAGACSDGAAPEAGRTTTSTTASTTATAAPTTAPRTTTTKPPPPPSRPATATCPAVPAIAAPDPDRPSYLMDVRVLLDQNAIEGRLTVRFRPDLATDELVFRLWPNGPRAGAAGAKLEAGPVFLGSSAPAPTSNPDPTTLVVDVGATLQPGQPIEATVPFRLTLPGAVNDRVARNGEAVRLGSFFPILAWEPGVGWARDPATGVYAEAATSPVADFDYSVTVPEGLGALATGVEDRGRWRATAVRDVAISVGRFTTATATANAPNPVAVTIGVHQGLGDDPASYLPRVVGALEDYARRYGPYPLKTFSLAITPGLSGGIEYPGHVMQGPDRSDRTTAHEVGHQWFYGLVGNDQGRDPWLDEALATWAQTRYDDSLAEVAGMAIPEGAVGHAREPMTFWEGMADNYYRGAYIQGAQALAALAGPEVIDCALALFVADRAYSIAQPRHLYDALGQVVTDLSPLLPYGLG